jgi:hypothetical protein
MGTSITRYLSPEEIAKLQADKEVIERMSSGVPSGKFVFFAAFDGTKNDKDHVALSHSPYQTNVANLYDQAEERKTANRPAHYYPGVGTGGEHGNIFNAAFLPTEPLRATAERALREFAREAQVFLQINRTATPADLSAATVGFSRGTASQVMFAQLLEERGLVLPDGTQVAPPGAVGVTAMVMIDPVHTFTKGNLSLPPNVQGDVLVFRAQDEHRTEFRLADYSADPRVRVVSLPGNHVGLGGGDDLHGTAAVVLEGSTGYLRNSDVELAPVPAQQRFDPTRPVPAYTEGYQTARNGDVLSDVETGRPATVWRLDDQGKERIGVPVSAARPPHSRPAAYEPRDPRHQDHALYSILETRLPDASESRLEQFTAACRATGITAKNLGKIYLLEEVGAVWFEPSWPPGPFAKVDLTTPMPSPEQMLQQVKGYDQQQAVLQAQFQARQAEIDQQQGLMPGVPIR